MTPEHKRVAEMGDSPHTWRLWGPYLSERQWGTVREDYSADGNAWRSFSHDQARSRAYRWGEDGLGGLSDIRQNLCFAVALWNGQDPILKERLFGLTNEEGNHGEDVKELYWYADATPTHSYLKFVYRYPQRAFPYTELIAQSAQRKADPSKKEFELWDTGIFDESRYFDITVEYAKAAIDDILIRITATNAGPDPAPLWLLPTLWFRNRWTWKPGIPRPRLVAKDNGIEATHERMGTYQLTCSDADHWLFTENESNHEHLWGTPNDSPYVKDAFHRWLVEGEHGAVNLAREGTKACAVVHRTVDPGETRELWLRLTALGATPPPEEKPAAEILATRRAEADAFYATIASEETSPDARQIQREAFAGLIWSKQFYRFDVARWLKGDPGQPVPPQRHTDGRDSAWPTLNASDILSMPDAWEYPWFASWDLAFHMIAFAQIDPAFAKYQLLLLCREWYMHPSGQLPAYEWAFGDVNPPVHAWAALRVYKIERKRQGKSRNEPGDTAFLERIFHKLLLNFTWWVNRKDAQGNNLFEGGFLGLDNIGVFDRSAPLPTGGSLEQSDGTAWMAMFALNMLAIALELCRVNRAYEDVATKFAEHFVYIASALNNSGVLWDEADGWFYDALRFPDGSTRRLLVRSIVGLIPTFAVEVFDADTLKAAPGFTERLNWFIRQKPDLCSGVAHLADPGQQERAIFALVGAKRLRRILSRALDEAEFLSPHGIRSLSRFHRERPFSLGVDGREYRVAYDPAESTSGLFGGNSNWRGPVWFPINYLFIEALQKYDYAYGTSFLIRGTDLWGVATDLSHRLMALFLRDSQGNRPSLGDNPLLQNAPHLLFHEYFHGDTGLGLGASHQTGWTALVAKLIAQSG